MTAAIGSLQIKSSMMEPGSKMEKFAEEVARQANTMYNENNVASHMKHSFEKEFSTSYWHCIVGKSPLH